METLVRAVTWCILLRRAVGCQLPLCSAPKHANDLQNEALIDIVRHCRILCVF